MAVKIAADRTLWAYVVPTGATVLLATILLNGAAGAAMAVSLAVLAGVMNGVALEPAVYTLAGGAAAMIAMVRAERLNAFVRAGLLLAVTNIAVLTAFSLLEQRDLAGILQGIAAASVNAALAVVLAVGSFAVIGNLFGIMTVFQLLELANPSSRLLRRLLLETPGTYHHSVMVGNLAERAAETIGADPLLARVAAYYHDIGKMKNPLAFIENQAGAHNIHDDLSAEVERPDHQRAHPRRHRPRLRERAAGADHRLHPAAPRHQRDELLLRQGPAPRSAATTSWCRTRRSAIRGPSRRAARRRS